MSYMDNLSQGYQNTYGGYTQMYRKQPQTQIGGSQIKAPMRISLDRMYGGMPTAPPGPPTAPTFPTAMPDDYVPTAGYDDYDTYMESQGWTLEQDDGEDYWMPPGQEGDIYESSLGRRYQYTGGIWTELGQIATSDLTILHFQSGAEIPMLQVWNSNYKEQYPNYIDFLLWVRDEQQKMLEGNIDPNAVVNYPAVFQKNIDSINEELQNLGYTTAGEEIAVSITGWQDQLTELMDQFEAGEIDYLDENGNLDVTALRGMGNVMSDWLADVLETSYETGLIQSDFFDEEGNLVPELGAMETFFESSPEAMDRWNQYNKRLAMHAISSGQSIESGYYSEVVANAVASYGAQVADQVIPLLQNEMKMQYDYIANSFYNALLEMGKGYAAEEFNIKMQNAYDAIQLEYETGMEQLRAAIAESEMSTMGSIFSGVFSFIVNMALTLF